MEAVMKSVFLALATAVILTMALLHYFCMSGVALESPQSMPEDELPYISEVAPVAAEGEPAWVEFTVGRVDLDPYSLYIPWVVNSGGAVSVGALPALPAAGFSLADWYILGKTSWSYTFPADTPELPHGTLVLLIFDGLGPGEDETDPGDGLITLHSHAGLTDPFDPDGDQVGLYNSSGELQDFVAWGSPWVEPAALDHKVASNQVSDWLSTNWMTGTYLIYEQGFGVGSQNNPTLPGESFGIWYESIDQGRRNWQSYARPESSPGRRNPPPAPMYSNIPDGAKISSETFSVSWLSVPGASAYHFQLDDDPNFASPEIDVITADSGWGSETPLPDGGYYWHVQVITNHGNFSQYFGPKFVSLEGLDIYLDVIPQVLLLNTDEYKIQHKDTTMLDIGGGPDNIPMTTNGGSQRYPLNNRWDGEHTDSSGNPVKSNAMDGMYCVRASTAMMADYYGGNLAQDRISYYMFEEWASSPAPMQDLPEHDLGYDSGIGAYGQHNEVLSWALGTTITGISYCPPNPNDGKDYTCPNPSAAPITWAQIKTWIDNQQPFASVNLRNMHMRVVDGYWEISPTSQWVHVIDPSPKSGQPNGARWEDYETFANHHERAYPGPSGRNGAPSVQSNEVTLNIDSDGDGINNFDEIYRFDTDPYNADTDGDWVDDKSDMAEYIFDDVSTAGLYYYTPGVKPDTSDYDNDGLRKEVDWDNDGDGVPDGCEDADLDGRLDSSGETSNFDKSDFQVCQPRFVIMDPLTNQAANAGDPTQPEKVLIRLDMSFPPALPNKPTFTTAMFSAKIGGVPAPAISGFQVGQEFWLLVQAPAQPFSQLYDLSVSYDGSINGHANQTRTEVQAVKYELRPRMDTVVVLDTSASMGVLNKLDYAKNAARLYIDQWSAGDQIGLVTFHNTCTLVSQLQFISADLQLLTDTKVLLDGLSATGQTAMGAGLRLGQQQLDTYGNDGHDHSMMLLSDGQENVDPKWGDPSVGGVIVDSDTVVNTIGFGPPTANWFGLLQWIASWTGGIFGAVDDPTILDLARPTAPDAILADFPTETPNQLADTYKYAAERILGEQRLFEAIGTIERTDPSDTYYFQVGNVPSLVVSANFDIADQAAIDVYNPGGMLVLPGDPGVEYRHDATHDQYRIPAPDAGQWRVDVRADIALPLTTEYIVFGAAHSMLTIDLVVGEVIDNSAQIIVLLADYAPVSGATVVLNVLRPNGATQVLAMYDDGHHGDVAADDGIYGATLIDISEGAYMLKAKASGLDNFGDAFTRYAQAMLIGSP
jgi:Mg-chelatase subunit ChlD